MCARPTNRTASRAVGEDDREQHDGQGSHEGHEQRRAALENGRPWTASRRETQTETEERPQPFEPRKQQDDDQEQTRQEVQRAPPLEVGERVRLDSGLHLGCRHPVDPERRVVARDADLVAGVERRPFPGAPRREADPQALVGPDVTRPRSSWHEPVPPVAVAHGARVTCSTTALPVEPPTVIGVKPRSPVGHRAIMPYGHAEGEGDERGGDQSTGT